MRTRILVCLYLVVAVLPLAAHVLHLSDRPIFGALAPAPRPALSGDAVRSEEYQKAFTAWFDSELGWKGYSITTDNAILLHAFHDTKPGPGVVLGKRGVLFSPEDIAYYNRGRDQLPSPAAVDALADKIAALQAALRAQHRALVPMLVPSKTSMYREAIPAERTRDLGLPRPTDVGVDQALRQALDARGVAYVDAHQVLTAPGVDRNQVWGPKARHWSTYGGCLTMREVMRTYVALTGNDQPPYDCPPEPRWRPPGHDDFDLWNLLNTWRPPKLDKQRTWAVHVPPADDVEKPTVIFVGTSFCWNIMRDASDSRRFRELHMNYYHHGVVAWPAGIDTEVAPYSKEWRALFLDRDLYVLDLFEPFLLESGIYVDQFLAEVGGEIERMAGARPQP
jgi:acetyltransferase AlgX (SGNH hydrolase-like protein)